uniref:Long-chain-alcohol O-fatty-acyltransferase n=1 Tax=Simmondsia chinensis TaxID=3999 RepID=WAXS1_SIMCH|nr:RecName: Full=Long-chain-alcohol O-fatty-acyltransferase; AltName: Full=Wax synthase [Simmondsia chinensis]AAD38041.1 wax synthase [Simmondsia chinensis]
MEVEKELKTFSEVWISAIAAACYCRFVPAVAPHGGALRLLLLLPVVLLFIFLPLRLSSFHLGGPTALYLVWLANFKLLLFAFHLGPLSNPSLSLLHFISTTLLPIKFRDDPSNDHEKNKRTLSFEWRKVVLFVAKLVFFAGILKIYEFRKDLPHFVISVLYCFHFYLGTEITLAASAVIARATLGLDLYPQFNEPYLATSLQDFWGRRWNLMVSDILGLTTYQPVRRVLSRWVRLRWEVAGAMLVAFTVSGLMHEVFFFYLTRARPSWEVTGFFVLHGVCTAVEMVVKKAVSGKVRLRREVSGALTVGFVMVTGGWLFLPQLVRHGVDLKTIDEYPVMFNYTQKKLMGLLGW